MSDERLKVLEARVAQWRALHERFRVAAEAWQIANDAAPKQTPRPLTDAEAAALKEFDPASHEWEAVTWEDAPLLLAEVAALIDDVKRLRE